MNMLMSLEMVLPMLAVTGGSAWGLTCLFGGWSHRRRQREENLKQMAEQAILDHGRRLVLQFPELEGCEWKYEERLDDWDIYISPYYRYFVKGGPADATPIGQVGGRRLRKGDTIADEPLREWAQAYAKIRGSNELYALKERIRASHPALTNTVWILSQWDPATWHCKMEGCFLESKETGNSPEKAVMATYLDWTERRRVAFPDETFPTEQLRDPEGPTISTEEP